MDYRELFKESNKEVEERFLLTRERIGEIAAGEKNGMKEQVHRYFKKTAQFLEIYYKKIFFPGAFYEKISSFSLYFSLFHNLWLSSFCP